MVDDGSRDGTADFVRQQTQLDPRVCLISYSPNRGKGNAVRAGVLAAKGRFVLFMDADGSTPIEEAEKVWPLLSGPFQVVLGSRGLRESKVEATQTPLRRLASDLFGVMTRMLVVYGVVDTQCGFKAFTKEAAQAVFSKLVVTSAIFDVELLLLCVRSGYSIAEVPVVWRHDQDSRITYDFRRSVKTILELVRIKWRHGVLWPVKAK